MAKKHSGNSDRSTTTVCPKCHGPGCGYCNGTGRVRRHRHTRGR